MNGTTKIAIGAFVTALMAWGAHGPLGMGAAFIDKLQKATDAGLAEKGIKGVTVTYPTDTLSRWPSLSGGATQADRDKATALVTSTPGVAYPKWADEAKMAAAPAPAMNEAAPVSNAAAVTACQAGVNAAVASRVINFKSGSAFIAADSEKILDDVAAALKPCAGMAVEIGGHTDSVGSAAINQTLSQERADRVKAALVERGVAADVLTATGYGSTKPANAADGRDPANRRIAFTVTKGGA